MPITKGYQQLVNEAMAEVTTYSVDEVRARIDDPALQIVDRRRRGFCHGLADQLLVPLGDGIMSSCLVSARNGIGGRPCLGRHCGWLLSPSDAADDRRSA